MQDPVTGKLVRVPAPTRWRVAQLIGFDVSSSQTQILAAFLGLTTLERVAGSRKPSFKERLAQHARETNALRDDYQDAKDAEKLLELVKELWMRRLYGSKVQRVVLDQSWDPDKYGLGWKDATAASAFLNSFPSYKKVEKFLKACHRVAAVAYEKDPCVGVVFEDPYDQAQVQWNPVKRIDKHLGSGDHNLIVSVAVGDPNEAGDYPVNLGKLTNMVAPCLVHMLDGFYSSLVMEELHQRGVRDFVAVHDCWLVPASIETDDGTWLGTGSDLLEASMVAASKTWFEGLEPVYDALIGYLRDTEFEEFVRDAKAAWLARREKARATGKGWPRFTAKPSTPIAITIDRSKGLSRPTVPSPIDRR